MTTMTTTSSAPLRMTSPSLGTKAKRNAAAAFLRRRRVCSRERRDTGCAAREAGFPNTQAGKLRRQADAADAAEAAASVRRAAPANAKPQMFMASPTRFVEGAKLADSLLEGKTVLLNLENAGKVDARRLLDFMSGAAYAMQGYVKRVSGSIYLVVPNGEEVTEADAVSQMESSGVFF